MFATRGLVRYSTAKNDNYKPYFLLLVLIKNWCPQYFIAVLNVDVLRIGFRTLFQGRVWQGVHAGAAV